APLSPPQSWGGLRGAPSLATAAASALTGRLILRYGYSAVYLLAIPFLFVGTLVYHAVFRRYERTGTAAAR
ncbi:MAG: hypothetical protein DRI79_13435, partial [Chloroflexi bacterium]